MEENESMLSIDNAEDNKELQALEAQKEKAKAEEAAAKAKYKLEKQKIKKEKSKDRAKRRSKIGVVFKAMSKTSKLIALIVILAIVVFGVTVLPGILFSGRTGVTISAAALKDAVTISKLSTAEFTYNGIAEKMKNNDSVEFHIYYEATAKAEANLDQIDFSIDEESKTITVLLPKIEISSPVVDESSLDFLPKNPNVQLREVIEICKQDVQRELETTTRVYEVAEKNLVDTLTALLKPIIGNEGYSFDWQSAMQVSEEGQTDEDN